MEKLKLDLKWIKPKWEKINNSPIQNKWNSIEIQITEQTDLSTLKQADQVSDSVKSNFEQLQDWISNFNEQIERTQNDTRKNLATALFWVALVENVKSNTTISENETWKTYENWDLTVTKQKNWVLNANYEWLTLNKTWDNYDLNKVSDLSILSWKYNEEKKTWHINYTENLWDWKTITTWIWVNNNDINLWLKNTKFSWEAAQVQDKNITYNTEEGNISWKISINETKNLENWEKIISWKTFWVTYDEKREWWSISYEKNFWDSKTNNITNYTLWKANDNLNISRTESQITDLWENNIQTEKETTTWTYNTENNNFSIWHSKNTQVNNWKKVLSSFWESREFSSNNWNLTYRDSRQETSINWKENYSYNRNLVVNHSENNSQISYNQTEKTSIWKKILTEDTNNINIQNKDWDLYGSVNFVRKDWDNNKNFEWKITEKWHNAKVNISDSDSSTTFSNSQNWEIKVNQITYQDKKPNETITYDVKHTQNPAWDKTEISYIRNENEGNRLQVQASQDKKNWLNSVSVTKENVDDEKTTKTSVTLSENWEDKTWSLTINQEEENGKFFNLWVSGKNNWDYSAWFEFWKNIQNEENWKNTDDKEKQISYRQVWENFFKWQENSWVIWGNTSNINWTEKNSLYAWIWNKNTDAWIKIEKETTDWETNFLVNLDGNVRFEREDSSKISIWWEINHNSNSWTEYNLWWKYISPDWRTIISWWVNYFDKINEEDSTELYLSLQSKIKRTDINTIVLYNPETWTNFNFTSNTNFNRFFNFMTSVWKDENWNFWKIWIKIRNS